MGRGRDMKRFCEECGHQAQASDQVCTECGTQLKKEKQPVVEKKAPISKKKMMMFGGIAILLVLMVGFYMYGNSYASAPKTLDRFKEAVLNKEKKKLGKLVEFEDGRKPSSAELDAILIYGEKEPQSFNQSVSAGGKALFEIKQTGRIFGVFKGHKLIMQDQYLEVPSQVNDMKYTLNGEEFKIDIKDEVGVIGPVAPGIYTVDLQYENEYTEYEESADVKLLSELSEPILADIDFNVKVVRPGVNKLIENGAVKLFIGKQEIELDEDGLAKEDIVYPRDKELKARVLAEFPWGEVESEEMQIDESQPHLNFVGINKKIEEDIAKVLLAYGEQIVEARAAVETKNLTTATDEWKKKVQAENEQLLANQGPYTGQLEEIQVSFESVGSSFSEDIPTLTFQYSYLTKEAIVIGGQQIELKNKLRDCSIVVLYLENEWKVNGCEENDWFSHEAGGTVLEASKKLYEPSDVKVEKKESEESSASAFEHKKLESFMQSYNEASVAAINDNDYGKVSGKVVSGSPRDKEQSDYLVYLNSKGITEDHVGTRLSSFKKIDDRTVEVRTKETFKIHYKDKDSVESTYTTVTQLKLVDGEWKAYKLISTK